MNANRSFSLSLPAGAVRDRARRLCLVGKATWSVVVCMSVRARCLVCRPRGTARIRPESTTQQHRSPPATTAATTPQSRVSFSSLVVSWRRPRLRSLRWWLVVTRCLLAWAGPERLGERRDTHPGCSGWFGRFCFSGFTMRRRRRWWWRRRRKCRRSPCPMAAVTI